MQQSCGPGCGTTSRDSWARHCKEALSIVRSLSCCNILQYWASLGKEYPPAGESLRRAESPPAHPQTLGEALQPSCCVVGRQDCPPTACPACPVATGSPPERHTWGASSWAGACIDLPGPWTPPPQGSCHHSCHHRAGLGGRDTGLHPLGGPLLPQPSPTLL